MVPEKPRFCQPVLNFSITVKSRAKSSSLNFLLQPLHFDQVSIGCIFMQGLGWYFLIVYRINKACLWNCINGFSKEDISWAFKVAKKILRNFSPGGVGARRAASRTGGQSGHRCNLWSALNWPTSWTELANQPLSWAVCCTYMEAAPEQYNTLNRSIRLCVPYNQTVVSCWSNRVLC